MVDIITHDVTEETLSPVAAALDITGDEDTVVLPTNVKTIDRLKNDLKILVRHQRELETSKKERVKDFNDQIKDVKDEISSVLDQLTMLGDSDDG